MSGLNKVLLIGRIGKDPETRYMTNGEAVTNVSLATSESWKDKDGEKQERTEWHNLVFYRRLAEIVGEYVKKGALLYVEGKIQTRKWQDKEGKDRYTTEVIVDQMQMLGSKSDAPTREDTEKAKAKPVVKQAKQTTSFDDDIPFADPYKQGGLWRAI